MIYIHEDKQESVTVHVFNDIVLVIQTELRKILKWIKNFKIKNLDIEIEKILKEILIIEYSSKDGWIKNYSWKVAIDKEKKNTI